MPAAAPSLPHDPAIPALVEMATVGVAPVLAAAGLDAPSATIELLKYHPGKRISFTVGVGSSRVVVKCFALGASPLLDVFAFFDATGLASGRAPTVPPLLAADRDRSMVVNEWITGEVASSLVERGRARIAGRLAAQWLVETDDRLQQCDLGPTLDPARMLLDVERYTRTIAKACGELTVPAHRSRDRLAASTIDRGPIGVRHGGYYLTHIFEHGDGPAVIDWDTFCQGPVELDAGMFLAMVSRWSIAQTAHSDVAALRSSFLAGVAPIVDAGRLAFYQAACLMKMASYLARHRFEGWIPSCAALLDEATAVMAGGG